MSRACFGGGKVGHLYRVKGVLKKNGLSLYFNIIPYPAFWNQLSPITGQWPRLQTIGVRLYTPLTLLMAYQQFMEIAVCRVLRSFTSDQHFIGCFTYTFNRYSIQYIPNELCPFISKKLRLYFSYSVSVFHTDKSKAHCFNYAN